MSAPTVNPWRVFQSLLPSGGRTVVEITAVGSDGTSLAELRDGTPIRVTGDTLQVGDKALVVNNTIVAQVPTLPQTSVTV